MSAAQRSKIERRVRALQLAQRLAHFGPRPGTLSLITGLPQKEVVELFPSDRIRSGRWPSAHEWYHTANLVQRVEASLVACLYRRNRDHEFEVVESLIDAYGRYSKLVPSTPAISFDRAFNLVCHLEGSVFGVESRSFDLATCPHCGARFLIQFGDLVPVTECIFDRMVQRFAKDARLQSHFPSSPLPDLSAFGRLMLFA